MSRPALALLVAVALAGTFAVALWQPSAAKRAARETAQAAASTDERDAPPQAAQDLGSPRPATASAAPGAGSSDHPTFADSRALDTYLASLVEAARQRGAVLDDDYRRGAEAIHSLTSQYGPRVAASRLRRFGKELQNVAKEIELRPLMAELDALLAQIGGAESGPERSALTAQYRAKSQQLPELYRIGAENRLMASTR